MEFHEIANILPMEKGSIASLAADITKNGQQIPIELYDGKILDGRRRWQACALAGVAPKTVEVNPDDPVGYVKSLNVYRRHLTPSQLSMVAARFRGYYDKQARERQGHGQTAPGQTLPVNLPEAIKKSSDARDAAGKEFGVSGKSVDHATKVLEKGVPELIEAVEEGRIAVSTAAILANEPEEVQRDKATKAKRTYTANRGGGTKTPQTAKRHVVVNGEVYDAPRYGVMAIEQLKRIKKEDPNRDSALDGVIKWIEKNR
ncbi:MAG: ParB N-terminal domain-containing protein [Vampirovibrionales bacterium]|nr:ParB N-terminal domain-containing protein [Vampirovibrionales bacterium]